MAQFDLSHAVSTFATLSARLGSLWGLYIAATFAAAGFGASQEQLSPVTAGLLTIAFLAFAAAHLRATMTMLKTLVAIRGEIVGRLMASPEEVTDYPVTIEAAMRLSLSPPASLAMHLVVDSCVIAVVWASVFIPV